MKKPIIGIVGRENVSKAEDKPIFSVDDNYRRAIIKSGGIPFVILPTQDFEYPHYNLDEDRELSIYEEKDLLEVLKLCDGFILPGGCKIYYYDKYIAEYAVENDVPVLGICLGMQTLAAIDCKEKVVEKIEKENNGHKNQEKFAHQVKISEDSFLYKIVKKEEFMVNSRHRCHVLKTNQFDVIRIF